LKGKGEKQVDVINLKKTQGGTERSYLLARLQRDHPKLAAQVCYVLARRLVRSSSNFLRGGGGGSGTGVGGFFGTG